ncbi:MAG: hypothetical protein GKS06_12205 [Acidobacteria bacterium]|nr:hypothetical protein [Acidobacteriota bacterium]
MAIKNHSDRSGGLPKVVVVAALWLTVTAAASQTSFMPFEERAYRLVNSVAFDPADETMYFALLHREVLEHRGLAQQEAPEVALYTAHREGRGWSEPQLLPFAGRYMDYEPTVTADGTLMVFNSQRPYPDGRISERNDLWMSENGRDGWGEPRRIDAISTFEHEESYSSLMADRTLVFSAGRPLPNGEIDFDIYVSEYVDGYQPATRLPVSTDRYGEGDTLVSQDGSYLIFTRWDDAIGWGESVDLYIAFQEDGRWTEPLAMTTLNTDGADYGAAVSPDGQWLYYRANSRFQRVALEPILDEYRARSTGTP